MKKVTLKNYEIEQYVNMLSEQDSLLNSSSPDKKMSLTINWKIDEFYSKLSNISKKIREKRDEIEKEYVSDEYSYEEEQLDGRIMRRIKPEYFPEFNSKVTELMNIDNEIEVSTIPLSLMEKYDITPNDFQSIKVILENDIEVVDGTVE